MKKKEIVQTHSFIRVCLFLIITLANLGVVSANETESSSNSLNVTLQPNSYSKIDQDIDFSIEKGQNYVFHVSVLNAGNQPIDVSIFSSTGQATSDSIEYVSKINRLLNENYSLTKYTSISYDGMPLKEGVITLKPNESQIIDIKIKIPLDSNLIGEILGGINFSQVIGTQKNQDAVDIVQMYQKVITVRLKISPLAKEERVPLEYKNFSFSTSKNATNLIYMVYNQNPLVNYSDEGRYKLINPAGKLIADGDLAYKKTILTPCTKTEMSAKLLDGAELVSGTYQFITNIAGHEKINTFDYSDKDIHNFLEENKNEMSITVSSGVSKILVFLTLLFALIITYLIIKSIILKRKE